MDETTDTRPTDALPAPLQLQRPWTKADVCGWFDVSENTLTTLIKDAGFPPPTMLGGLRLPRWRASDVLAWQHAQFDADATRPAPATSVGPVRATDTGRPFGVVDRRPRKSPA